MDTQRLLTKPVDQIGFNERMNLISDLIRHAQFQHVRPDKDTCVMSFGADGVKPGEVCQVKQRVYAPFLITGMYIIETSREIDDITVTQTVSENSTSTTSTRTKRIVSVAPSSWTLHETFFGNTLAHLQRSQTFPGAGFSITLPFETMYVPLGIDVVMNISHSLTTLADFRALLFGVPRK